MSPHSNTEQADRDRLADIGLVADTRQPRRYGDSAEHHDEPVAS